jgi:hypothetical protein
MEKMNKKENRNIPNKQNQNNLHKFNKKNTQNNNILRPSSNTKIMNKNSISNSKKSNTPKKCSIQNLNDCAIPQKEIKEPNEKHIPKKLVKKQSNKKDMNNINMNNINQSSPKSINLLDQLTNLTSLYNALSFINNKLDSTFSSQRNEAEKSLHNKYSEAIELKEKNFKIFQQINSMTNIIDIDDYFINNYNKMMTIYPKVSNVVENMNDIVSNINYSVDRMYLVDDLLCDEKVLQNNIMQIKNDFEIMNKNIEKKIDEINCNKRKYDELFNKLNYNDEETKKIENRLGSFKQNVLTSNIDIIYQTLLNKNQKLLNDILND